MDFNYGKEILKIREKYKKKKFNGEIPCPVWMEKDKLYDNLYAEKQRIFSEGEICYGWIIQANKILFDFFPQIDCPATIIYSHDEIVNCNPWLLEYIAKGIYAYKESPLNEVPELFRDVVACVQDEYDRASFTGTLLFKDEGVLDLYGEDEKCYYSGTLEAKGLKFSVCIATTMIYRRFIPARKIVCSMMPVIALSNDAAKMHILPKKYWTRKLTKHICTRKRWWQL